MAIVKQQKCSQISEQRQQTNDLYKLLGDPYGIRTRVDNVRGCRPNH